MAFENVFFADKTLECRDCGRTFVFTVGEQGYYLDKGLRFDPGRCQDCRATRKAERQATTQPSESTSVICDDCGISAVVPFVPHKDRPVYCHSCYGKRR